MKRHITKCPNDWVIETVNECCILYKDNFKICFADYYYYVISVIRRVICEIDKLKINIIFNISVDFIDTYNFNNENRTVIVYINEEHTLISKGAWMYNDYNTYTKILNTADDYYKIVIQNPELIKKSDIIINYSAVNHMNFKISMDFKDVFKKMTLVHPLIYPYYNGSRDNRNIHCLTTFLFPDRTQKRIDFLNTLRVNGINHVNVNTCETTGDFIRLYMNTQILINIHQTYDFHTVEELRILPALMCGVIVICEEGPLKEYIPYQNYIVWTTQENMIRTIRHVEANYEDFYNKFFSESRLSNLLEIMAESNKHELYDKLSVFTGVYSAKTPGNMKLWHPKISGDYGTQDVFLLLDLDGTILDTDRLHFNSYYEVLKSKYILTYEKFDEVLNTVGMPNFLIEKFGEDEYKTIKNEKDAHFMSTNNKIVFTKGAEELINYILLNHINYAIVTNSRKSMVDYFKTCLPRLNLLNNWVTREDYTLPKPNHESFLLGLSKYRKGEKYVIGIENTILGYQSLKHATDCIYIMAEKTNYNYDYFTREDVGLIDDFSRIFA